ncbi:family 31 glycoside hydrolase, partial [Suillus cothurnatus]
FILTCTFYVSSQHFGAMWTGDNHILPPLLPITSFLTIHLLTANVGSFFGNPEPEMLVRWYIVGSFLPFFHAHVHINMKCQEPYLLEELYKSLLRDILRLRHSMLPVWYTAFRETDENGVSILGPQYVMFSEDEAGFGINDWCYIRLSRLLVKPVMQKGAKEVFVYIAEDQVYYDYFT